jgi:hypothetical protein
LQSPHEFFIRDGIYDLVSFGTSSNDPRASFYADELMNNKYIAELHDPASA